MPHFFSHLCTLNSENMLRVALVDLNNNQPNKSIGMLQRTLDSYSELTWQRYEVRKAMEIPDMSHDIYLLSGGPGDPLENDGPWFDKYLAFIQQLWDFNQLPGVTPKHCLFICHSFQMACHQYRIGTLSRREKYSFGTYPVHKTQDGKGEACFQPLPDPFYIADFRQYQVTKPDYSRMKQMGASILCFEKLRPHVNLERAIMAVRFSSTMIGTQFHPEADPAGLREHFVQQERKAQIIDQYGEARYNRMMTDLANPQKIQLTYETIVPGFLRSAIMSLKGIAQLVNS
jgi:homoserine O-succinyltransferase/O-acetyltransferase